MGRTLTTGLWLGVLASSAVARAQDAAEQQMTMGLAAYQRLHFHEAESHFQAAVDVDPGSAAALYYLAYTVYKIAEPKKPNDPGKRAAAELFARAYQVDPGFTPDWGVAGRPQRSARKVHLRLDVLHGPVRTRVDTRRGPSF